MAKVLYVLLVPAPPTGKAPPTVNKGSGNETPEDFPDYQDSLRRYALGLSPEEGSRTREGGGKAERQGSRDSSKTEEGEEGGTVAEGKETEAATGKEGEGSAGEKAVVEGEKGEAAREEGGERPDGKTEVEKEPLGQASTKASTGSKTPSNKDSPHKPRSVHAGRPPTAPYPYHLQNGYPSDPGYAGMHEHFPPGMVPPYPPPYQHVQSKGIPPGYPGYYGNRNPYYPHPYMQGELSTLVTKQLAFM